jgi:PAS domain S-box-containing protein
MVSIPRLEGIFERFSQATGLTFGLFSYPEKELLISTGASDICGRFHRENPRSEVDCRRTSLEQTEVLDNEVVLTIHRCPTGLIDGVVPIVIEGEHVANLITGQVLFGEPDEERFTRQAVAYDVDVATYLADIRRVPVISERVFRSAIVFLSEMAMLLAELGLSDLKNQESLRAARESEAKFRSLVESTSDWIWEVDERGTYTYASPQIESMLGYTPDEVIGKTPFDLMPDDEAARVRAVFADLIDGGRPIVGLENVNLHKNGHRVVLETSGVPIIDAHGVAQGYRGVDRDVTERKHAEKSMQTVERLESIGLLAGGIAHDFNNILMGLYGNISIAKDRVPSNHPAFSALSEAEKSLKRATSLTRQLLTFSKGGTPVFETADIAELVIEIARFDLSGSNVTAEFSKNDGLWPVLVDKGQIQQAFSNLIINAAQAMPDGGRIEISFSNEFVEANRIENLSEGEYVKTTFSDEGVGIDSSIINQIFDPYFTTKNTGSGLGLATAYSIVTKHGGHISVASSLADGTTVSVYLLASEVRKSGSYESENTRRLVIQKRHRVLVMDDDKNVLDVVCEMLEILGFSFDTARDGKEAIDKYRSGMEIGDPFSVVIMDLTIPGGVGGREAIARLLQIDPGVKAVVSSGYADDLVLSNYTEYGFKAIAAKPYSLDKLNEIMSRVLNEV